MIRKMLLSVAIVFMSLICFKVNLMAATTVKITASDIERLERLCYAEAGNQTLTAQKLVCAVVINRCYSDQFPNDVESVIRQNDGHTYQFSCVPNGMYDNAQPTAQCHDAVIACLREMRNGTIDVPAEVLYFRSGHFFNWSTVSDWRQDGDMFFSVANS